MGLMAACRAEQQQQHASKLNRQQQVPLLVSDRPQGQRHSSRAIYLHPPQPCLSLLCTLSTLKQTNLTLPTYSNKPRYTPLPPPPPRP
jgi:hypothetical protein